MSDGRIVVNSLYANEEHIEAVTAIYLQHFLIDANTRNRDQFLKDMLNSKYKEWPPATNFVSARTVILQRGDSIVSAATIRLHRMSHSKFLEVILFATHKEHIKRGYGGLLSSVLLWKAHVADCRHILLRSSNSSTFFWCSQGYKAYPYSKTTKTDALMCYYDNHCLAFPETVLMYREVGQAFPWVEISLSRCRDRLVLDDMDVSITPLGSRSRMGPSPDKVTCSVHPLDEPLDADTRKGSGLFDNEKLTAEQLLPPKPPAKKRRGWQSVPAAPSPEPQPKRRRAPSAAPDRHPEVFANEAQYVQHQLLLVREQLKLLQERKKFLLPKPAAVPIVAAPGPAESPAAPEVQELLVLQRLEERKATRKAQQQEQLQRFWQEKQMLQAGQWPPRVGCPDLSALPSCMLVNSNLYFPPPLLPPALPPALPPGDQWAAQGGPPPSDPALLQTNLKPFNASPPSPLDGVVLPPAVPWQQCLPDPISAISAQQAQILRNFATERMALYRQLSPALNSLRPSLPPAPFQPAVTPAYAASLNAFPGAFDPSLTPSCLLPPIA
eukprot:EG_transcript_8768